jgi:hypothetical protein
MDSEVEPFSGGCPGWMARGRRFAGAGTNGRSRHGPDRSGLYRQHQPRGDGCDGRPTPQDACGSADARDPADSAEGDELDAPGVIAIRSGLSPDVACPDVNASLPSFLNRLSQKDTRAAGFPSVIDRISAVSLAVERPLHTRKVTGSNPVPRTIPDFLSRRDWSIFLRPITLATR